MTRVLFDDLLSDTYYDCDPPKISTSNAPGILLNKLSTETNPNTMLRLIEELIHIVDGEREVVRKINSVRRGAGISISG